VLALSAACICMQMQLHFSLYLPVCILTTPPYCKHIYHINCVHIQVGLTDITPFAVEVRLADLPSNSASDDESGGAFKHMFDKLKHSKDSKKEAKKAAAAKSDSPDATAGDSDSSSDGRSGEPFTKTIRLFNALATVTGSAGKKAFALTHARDIT
jgi:hypothetical protein